MSNDLIVQIQHGDNVVLMRQLPDNCIGAVVCDPPYGLAFMGKEWDAPWKEIEEGEEEEDLPPTVAARRAFQEWATIWLKECHRILQPGGLIKVFGGTRMYHRMGAAMAAAGFEITHLEAWVYGSGFPKSHDVSKALDKMAGAEREVVGTRSGQKNTGSGRYNWNNPDDPTDRSVVQITEPASDMAIKFKGYGTCLKPAWEPFLVGRKSL